MIAINAIGAFGYLLRQELVFRGCTMRETQQGSSEAVVPFSHLLTQRCVSSSFGAAKFNCQEQKERLDIFIFSLRDKVFAISRDVRQQIDVLARSCENCICRAASSGDADLVARAKRTQVLSWKTEFWQVMA